MSKALVSGITVVDARAGLRVVRVGERGKLK